MEKDVFRSPTVMDNCSILEKTEDRVLLKVNDIEYWSTVLHHFYCFSDTKISEN